MINVSKKTFNLILKKKSTGLCRWSGRDDTAMELSFFAKHRNRGDAKRNLGAGSARTTPRAHTTTAARGGAPHTTITKALNAVASKAASSGRVPPSKGEPEPHPHQRNPPNAIVAHLREGLDIVNLYTGRPICRLPLPPSGLHVDLNGDGVLDHVVAVGSNYEQHLGMTAHAHMEHCHGYVHTGLPPNIALFNGSICKNNAASDILGTREMGDGARWMVEVRSDFQSFFFQNYTNYCFDTLTQKIVFFRSSK